MPFPLKLAYSAGVLVILPFTALYGAVTAFVGAVEGALLLLWDCWK